MNTTTARAFVEPLPGRSDGSVRLQVCCTWSTTTARLVPGAEDERTGLELLVARHAEACGRCNLGPLRRRGPGGNRLHDVSGFAAVLPAGREN